MGTWDIGFFDNDMACDWENEIKNQMTLEYIETTLRPVLENGEETSDDELDIDLANRGLAAVDALARLAGKEREKNSYTKHIDAWAENFNENIPEDLIQLALEVLDRVKSENSELHMYWKIRGQKSEWFELINRLRDQLEG